MTQGPEDLPPPDPASAPYDGAPPPVRDFPPPVAPPPQYPPLGVPGAALPPAYQGAPYGAPISSSGNGFPPTGPPSPQAAQHRRSARFYFLGALALLAAASVVIIVQERGGHTFLWLGGVFIAARLIMTARRHYSASTQLGHGTLTSVERGIAVVAVVGVVCLFGVAAYQYFVPTKPSTGQCYADKGNKVATVDCSDSTAAYTQGPTVTNPSQCPTASDSYVDAGDGKYYCLLPK
jgi:hypothetical protein